MCIVYTILFIIWQLERNATSSRASLCPCIWDRIVFMASLWSKFIIFFCKKISINENRAERFKIEFSSARRLVGRKFILILLIRKFGLFFLPSLGGKKVTLFPSSWYYRKKLIYSGSASVSTSIQNMYQKNQVEQAKASVSPRSIIILRNFLN